MTDRQIGIIWSTIGNIFLFGMFGYAVFILHFSSWWFLYPALIHFTIKDWEDGEE